LNNRRRTRVLCKSVHEKYELPNVISGVDGCHFSFMEKTRGIPAGRKPFAYINREPFVHYSTV
jgi:hypothetical protein